MYNFWLARKEQKKDPHGFILTPVYDAIVEKENSTMVGFLIGITPYGNLLDRLVPEGKDGVIGVFKDDCGNELSFELSSKKARFMGYEDLHESEFNKYEHVEENIEMYPERINGICTHDLYLYPSSKLRDSYQTSQPIIYTSLVAVAFLVVIALFFLYDISINKRQNKTIATALKTQAIVTSLFPEELGKRMIKEAHGQTESGDFNKDLYNNSRIYSENDGKRGNALAKLYPEATVMVSQRFKQIS